MPEWGTPPDGSPRQTRIVVICAALAMIIMCVAFARRGHHDVPWPPRSPASPTATR